MSTIIVAKKDFRDAIRSRTILALTLLFAVFALGGVFVGTQLPKLMGGSSDQNLDIVLGLLSPAGLLVPIIGLLVGYKAVVGERESGSLKCLLAFPHTRRDVVFGKVIGRTGVIAVSIIIGFTVGGIALYVFSGSFPSVNYIIFTLTTILLGLVFVSLAVALSSATTSTTRAAWGAFGFFALFQFLWSILGFILLYIITGSFIPKPPIPDWYLLFSRLNPQSAYQAAATAVLPSTGSVTGALASGSSSNLPFFLEGWFGFVILAVWLVVPLGLGYFRFQRSDL
jgi:ABC-2 type transport system permease protein